jgi:hypothetical protein
MRDETKREAVRDMLLHDPSVKYFLAAVGITALYLVFSSKIAF